MAFTNLPHLSELQFNVAGLLRETAGGSRSAELTVPPSRIALLDETFDVVAPLHGTIRLIKADINVLVNFVGDTTLRLTCARCLEPFDCNLHVDLDEEFRPSVDIISGAELSDLGDDEALVIDEHHVLDVSEVMRQAILLSLPLLPVCRDDCQGLCPNCGANRNFEQCDCQTAELDPRWAALSALIINESE